MSSGYSFYRACVFCWCHARSNHKKKKQSKKIDIDMRSRTRFVVRVHSILDAGPCCWDSCRGHVCDPTPLAGVGGYSRHKVSLWHTFLTGHTFSCHKTALLRAKPWILTRPAVQVCIVGSSAANNVQSALIFSIPERVGLYSHGTGL